MKRLIALLVVTGVTASCTGSLSSAPTFAASLVTTGALTLGPCTNVTTTELTCAYSGPAANEGNGCAARVHGSIIAFTNGVAFGPSQWDYPSSIVVPVRPGEQFIYTGSALRVPRNDFNFNTQFSWTAVQCP
jgi:hypothetical protein